MTLKDMIVAQRKLFSLTLLLAVSIGLNSQIAQADNVVTYSLDTDVVELIKPVGQTMITANGEIVTTDGRILGLVSTPGKRVNFIKSKGVPTAKYVTLTQSSDLILAASLSNRISALEDLANRETQLGNVTESLHKNILSNLSSARANLRRNMSYSKALKIGLDLDQIAMSLKRSEKLVLVTDYVLRPMVVETPDEPSGKRLTIFMQSIKGDDGVTTTKTTTTETTEY